ncbi:hypothetical protein NUW54_g6688 [Trametes sanguinea]|uniref:Uncharacterized protein n=1 Tax=Trametes sanguinea TaxID=158606 RepID=A0ACC1PRI4_9APHY|nr:hypothetical protein NUW54_g6688 [Trametes sanguinea]
MRQCSPSKKRASACHVFLDERSAEAWAHFRAHSAPRWWLMYVYKLALVVRNRPWGDVALDRGLWRSALARAAECECCRVNFLPGFREYAEGLGGEIERAIAKTYLFILPLVPLDDPGRRVERPDGHAITFPVSVLMYCIRTAPATSTTPPDDTPRTHRVDNHSHTCRLLVRPIASLLAAAADYRAIIQRCAMMTSPRPGGLIRAVSVRALTDAYARDRGAHLVRVQALRRILVVQDNVSTQDRTKAREAVRNRMGSPARDGASTEMMNATLVLQNRLRQRTIAHRDHRKREQGHGQAQLARARGATAGEEDELSDLEDAVSSGDEDEDDEEEEGSDEDEEEPPSKKSTLGKRKAPSRTDKPPRKGPEKKARRGPRVEVEYEHEMESVPLTKEAVANW